LCAIFDMHVDLPYNLHRLVGVGLQHNFRFAELTSGNILLLVASEIIETATPVSNSIVSDFPSTSTVTSMGVTAGALSLNMKNSSESESETPCRTKLVRWCEVGWHC